MDKKYQVVTHNGVFHADEVMAIAIIRQVLPEIPVARTRDPEIISESLVVVDVGEIYDESLMRFDHHQREGAGERGENEIPYSSCGLVWKRFGMEICSRCFEKITDQRELFSAVDKGLISAIDLIDCGANKALGLPDAVPFLGISQIISGHNGGWSKKEAFSDAVSIAVKILHNEIRRCAEVIRARRRLEHDVITSTVPVLVMQEFAPGWAQTPLVRDAGFTRVIFQDVGGTWCLQVVPETTMLPSSWGGLNGEDLVAECGVDDATFCHKGLFIAGCTRFAGALAMAYASIPVI